MICSKCDRPIQRGQSSTTWWEEKNGKQLYRVAHVECPTRAFNPPKSILRKAWKRAMRESPK